MVAEQAADDGLAGGVPAAGGVAIFGLAGARACGHVCQRGGVVMCLCEGDQRVGGDPWQTEVLLTVFLWLEGQRSVPRGVVVFGFASPMPFRSLLCVFVPARAVFALLF